MGTCSLSAACELQYGKDQAVPMGAATRRLKAELSSFTTELLSLFASTRGPSVNCAEAVTACVFVKHCSTLSGGITALLLQKPLKMDNTAMPRQMQIRWLAVAEQTCRQ